MYITFETSFFFTTSGIHRKWELTKSELTYHTSYLTQCGTFDPSCGVSALLFLYRQVLKIDLPYIDHIERAKKTERLPVVFSRSEVKQILAHLDGVEHLVVSLLDGSGMCLMEGLRLRGKDFDFDHGQITVRDSKGKKDRQTMLSKPLETPL